mmetsp:Transcript_16359/g.52948  ORF Transcript_16359/g.52948 Transcript_16359/m.52948 type:complete len:212 (+) Transcript_16359:833-1468(+)
MVHCRQVPGTARPQSCSTETPRPPRLPRKRRPPTSVAALTVATCEPSGSYSASTGLPRSSSFTTAPQDPTANGATHGSRCESSVRSRGHAARCLGSGERGATRASQKPPSGAREMPSGVPGSLSMSTSVSPARGQAPPPPPTPPPLQSASRSQKRRTRLRFVSTTATQAPSADSATPFAYEMPSSSTAVRREAGSYRSNRPVVPPCSEVSR